MKRLISIFLFLVILFAGCVGSVGKTDNIDEIEENSYKVSNEISTDEEKVLLQIQNAIFDEFPLEASRITKSSGKNPTKTELIEAMKIIGNKYQVPFEIIYGIGVGETGGYNGGVPCQFWSNGNPIVSGDNGIGMMQVTPWAISQNFDEYSLKYDWKYNLEAGAQVILSKWRYVEARNPIGDMNWKVLENWYMTLWAYNGLSTITLMNTKMAQEHGIMDI